MSAALPGITREQLAEVRARLLAAVHSTRERYDRERSAAELARVAHLEAVRDAHAAGLSHTQIAQEAGVSRQRIGAIVGRPWGDA